MKKHLKPNSDHIYKNILLILTLILHGCNSKHQNPVDTQVGNEVVSKELLQSTLSFSSTPLETVQFSKFNISFKIEADASNVDSVTGLSYEKASSFRDLAIALRFNTSGKIDAINQTAYNALTPFPYLPKTLYDVTLAVDIPNKKYSMSVSGANKEKVVIAHNFHFRSEQNNTKSLSYLVISSVFGSHKTSSVVVSQYSLESVSASLKESVDDIKKEDEKEVALPTMQSSPENNEIPSELNTGNISPRSQLSTVAGLTVIQDGAVIEKKYITGTVIINANNVTVRDCIIRTSNHYGIQIISGKKGTLIEDCSISGMKSAAVLGSNFVARRLEVFDSGADGFKPEENFTIERSYIHSLGYISDSHSDGVQMVKGKNGIIRFNRFQMPYNVPGYTNSQVLIFQTNNGTLDNIHIHNNWINGGGYSVQIRDKGTGFGKPTNITLHNNYFGKQFQFGPWKIDGGTSLKGNIWQDTGLAVK